MQFMVYDCGDVAGFPHAHNAAICHDSRRAGAACLRSPLRAGGHVRTSQPAGAAVKPNFPSAAASLTNTSGASSINASIASYGPGPCDEATGWPFTLLST